MNKILRVLLYVILLLALVIAGVALFEGRNVRKLKVIRRAPKTNSVISFKDVDAVSVDMSNPKFVRYFKEGKVGVAVGDGNVVTDAVFDSVDYFYEDVSVVKLDGKYGFIGVDANYIVEPKYKMAYPFQYGYAVVVGDNGKYGVVDAEGNEILKPEYYDNISSFDLYGNAVATNEADKKRVVIDATGKVVRDLSPKQKQVEKKPVADKVEKTGKKVAPVKKTVPAKKDVAKTATATTTTTTTTKTNAVKNTVKNQNGVEVVSGEDEVEVVSDKEEEVLSGNNK